MLDDANILWTCIAAFLVFFMQVGLAFLESGSTRAKNVCNIFMKNLMDVSAVSIVFWLFGFGIMFGLGRSNIRGSIWRMALSFWPYTALGSGAFQAPSGLARNAAQDVPQSIF
jgi:ammonia channel protein AmtB